jgi:hypothetical protein
MPNLIAGFLSDDSFLEYAVDARPTLYDLWSSVPTAEQRDSRAEWPLFVRQVAEAAHFLFFARDRWERLLEPLKESDYFPSRSDSLWIEGRYASSEDVVVVPNGSTEEPQFMLFAGGEAPEAMAVVSLSIETGEIQTRAGACLPRQDGSDGAWRCPMPNCCFGPFKRRENGVTVIRCRDECA